MAAAHGPSGKSTDTIESQQIVHNKMSFNRVVTVNVNVLCPQPLHHHHYYYNESKNNNHDSDDSDKESNNNDDDGHDHTPPVVPKPISAEPANGSAHTTGSGHKADHVVADAPVTEGPAVTKNCGAASSTADQDMMSNDQQAKSTNICTGVDRASDKKQVKNKPSTNKPCDHKKVVKGSCGLKANKPKQWWQ